MLPELETFEEMRDADGMLLMLAMEWNNTIHTIR
jgi:hypothetical protein